MSKVLTLDEFIRDNSITEGFSATRVLDDGREQCGLLFKDNNGSDIFAIYGTSLQEEFGSIEEIWNTNKDKLRFVHSKNTNEDKDNTDKWRILLYANSKKNRQVKQDDGSESEEYVASSDNSSSENAEENEALKDSPIACGNDMVNGKIDTTSSLDCIGKTIVVSTPEENLVINKDYIGTIRERQGFLEYQKIDIPHFYDILIEDLERVKDDGSLTILDLQNRFIQDFPIDEYSDNKYSFVFPNTYNSSFITLPDYYQQGLTVDYPSVISNDEFKEQEDEVIEEDKIVYIQTILDESEVNKVITKETRELLLQNREEGNISEGYFRKVIDETFCLIGVNDCIAKEKKERFLQERYEKRNKARKNEYFSKAVHFIYAFQYDYILKRVMSISDIRMYSTDQCGWKGFEYKIDNNVSICVNTNFGFGSSSYFLCTLQYKGVDILPYQEYIQYYYANMQDMLRCTRKYRTARSSWEYVFRFVVNTVNRAKKNNDDFEQNFILNEVKCMVEGLRILIDKPQELIKTIKGRSPIDSDGLVFVRNIDRLDIELYEVFPHEKLLTDKIAKITGSLGFLENLHKLSAFISNITPYITEIKAMSTNLLPEIDKLIKQVEDGISKLRKEEEYTQNRISTIEKFLKQHVERIIRMYKAKYHIDVKLSIEDITELITRDGSVYTWEWGENMALSGEEKTYLKNTPQYKTLVSECKEHRQRLKVVKRHILLRENLLEVLSNSKNRIANE